VWRDKNIVGQVWATKGLNSEPLPNLVHDTVPVVRTHWMGDDDE